MKWLVGTTCVVVLAAAGYFVWVDRIDRAEIERVDAVAAELMARQADRQCAAALVDVQRGGDFSASRRKLDQCEAMGWENPDDRKKATSPALTHTFSGADLLRKQGEQPSDGPGPL
jgi:hypothetical protein